MKDQLRRLFHPLLKRFENTSDEYILTPTNRKVTLFIGVTFTIIAIVIPIISGLENWAGLLIPVSVFGVIGLASVIVGCLGSDHAVAKLLGNRKTKLTGSRKK